MDHGPRWLRLCFKKPGWQRRHHQQLVQVASPPPPPLASFRPAPAAPPLPKPPAGSFLQTPPPPVAPPLNIPRGLPQPPTRSPPGPPSPPVVPYAPVGTPPPPPVATSLPSPQSILGLHRGSSSGAEEILQKIKTEGPKVAISNNWERIKELHEQEAFSVQQIAWLFDRCRSVTALRTSVLNPRNEGNSDEASVALGTLIVQLFTNFICHQIPKLEPSEITSFIEALTSPALPMDEFWLFMMAKQIQDTSDRFSPHQIVVIARCYASKGLEDEEFFEALCSAVHGRLAEFNLHQLAHFLFSCARVRFLHQELCAASFPLFQDASLVSTLDGAALGAVITSASMLDWRTFRSLPCCQLLASRPWQDIHAAQGASDLAMGLVLALVYMQSSSGSRLLLPVLLDSFSSSLSKVNRSKSQVAMLQRRVILTGLCAAFGVPKREAWDLAQLRMVKDTFEKLQNYLDRTGTKTNSWEPESSRLHLEVVAILNLLEVQHRLEHPQMPFQLDIMITPEQFKAANLENPGEEPSG